MGVVDKKIVFKPEYAYTSSINQVTDKVNTVSDQIKQVEEDIYKKLMRDDKMRRRYVWTHARRRR